MYFLSLLNSIDSVQLTKSGLNANGRVQLPQTCGTTDHMFCLKSRNYYALSIKLTCQERSCFHVHNYPNKQDLRNSPRQYYVINFINVGICSYFSILTVVAFKPWYSMDDWDTSTDFYLLFSRLKSKTVPSGSLIFSILFNRYHKISEYYV